MTKYWIGAAGGSFNADTNWSTTTGGANDTTHPTGTDVATFDIIFISKALKLDSNKNVIDDIYDQVKAKDGTYANLTDGQYVRVTFERELDKTKDITSSLRATEGSAAIPSIQVYPVYTDSNGNQTEGPLVATFQNINQEKTYKVLLTNLDTPTDQFDLKISGDVSIDYIVDPAAALTAWYKLDDNAADTVVADSSGNSNTGTAARNTSLTYTASGKVGGALDFNGSTDAVDGGSDFIGTSATTIAAWVYLDSYGEPAGSGSGRIFDNGKFLIFGHEGAGNQNIKFYSNGSTFAASAVNSVLTGAWYHIVATRTTDGTANLYVNGVLSGAANQASGTPAGGTTNVFIGNRSATDRAFDGKIDDVRIYNEVLPLSKIQALYRSGAGSDLLQPWNIWSSTASTDYSVDANWSLGHVPTTGETAYFDGTSVVNCTLSANVTPDALTMMAAYTGTLAIGTYNMTVTGDSSVAGIVTIGVSADTGWTAVNFTVAAGGAITATGNAKVTISGNYVQSSTTSKFVASTATITINGNGTFTADGTLDSTQYNSATLVLNGTNTLTYANLGSSTANGFNSLTCGQGGLTTSLANTMAIGVMTIGSGTLTKTSGASKIVYLLGATPLVFDAASHVSVSLLVFIGTTQTIPSLVNGYDSPISLNKSGGTVTQTGDVVINGTGSFVIANNVVAIQTFLTDGYNLTVGGNLTIGMGSDTGLKKLDATRYGDGIPANGGRTSTITVGGNWLNYGTSTAPSQFVADNSTVIFNASTGTQTLTSGSLTAGTYPFNNLIHSGAGTLQLLDNIWIKGQWLNSAGTLNANGKTLSNNYQSAF